MLKKYSVILTYLIIAGCTENRTPTEVESVQFTTKVQVIDTSFVTSAIHDTTLVPNAKVTLYSISYEMVYQEISNADGIALFTGIVPDIYNASVQKNYPADTVKKYLPIDQDINLVGSMATLAMKSQADSFRIHLKPVLSSNILLSEIYYNGAESPPGYYFHDQFTEIYNNSSETIYLDDYAIADVTSGHRDDPDFIHSVHLYKFPGNGKDYPIQPGEIILIAQDAINHLEINANSLDLSNVDFEYYNHLSNDIDNPLVPNMIQIYHKYGIDFLYSVMNESIVLLKMEPADSILTYDEFEYILIPRERVVDAVEYREDLREYEYKRLADDMDAGITGGLPMYQGKSIARKVFNEVDGQIILMDNNNSSIDFQVLDTPTPGLLE